MDFYRLTCRNGIVSPRHFQWLLILSLAMSVGYTYCCQVIVPRRIFAQEYESKILARTAESPYAYRLLAPTTIRVATVLLQPLCGEGVAFVLAEAAYCSASILFSVYLLYILFRRWFSEVMALLGVALAALSMTAAARDHGFQPWSWAEPGLYALAILFGMDRKPKAGAILTAVATLNRETGLFVPILYILAEPGVLRSLRKALTLAVQLGVWGVFFGGLRIVVGWRPHPTDIRFHLSYNITLHGIAHAAAAVLGFLGLAWLVGLLNTQNTPVVLKRLRWALLLYFPTIALFSLWFEVRLWMPMLPILVPGALVLLSPRRGPALGQRGSPELLGLDDVVEMKHGY